MARFLIVPVFSGDVSIDDVCEALRDHGLVVIETVRPDASRIFRLASASLGISPDDDEGPYLIHLAIPIEPVEEIGFVDYLLYSESFDGGSAKASVAVTAAVKSWLSAASPDRHWARVPKQVRLDPCATPNRFPRRGSNTTP